MKIKCINDNCTTEGLTIGKEYEVMDSCFCAGLLYKITDDNGNIKRYTPDFFEKVENETNERECS